MNNFHAFKMLAALGIVASAALIVGLFLVTKHMDSDQRRRDFQFVSSQIRTNLNSSLQSVANFSKSDDAVHHLDAIQDPRWGDAAFPQPAGSQVWVYTVSHDNTIISGLHGQAGHIAGLAQLESGFAKWAADLRQESWGSAPWSPGKTMRAVKTFRWSGSRLYLVLCAPFLPSTPALHLMHRLPPLLFLVTPMDAYLQTNLAQAVSGDFTIVAGPPSQAAPGVPLADAQGRIVANITWRQFDPGSELWRMLLAPLLLLVGVFGALVLVTYQRGMVAARKLVESEARAHHLAFHDELTQLANRRSFLTELEAAVAAAGCGKGVLSVLLIDLDRFKSVNDTYGHHAGDELIRQVGLRLKHIRPGRDLCARLGGDEFVILSNGCAEDNAMALAQQIVRALSEPFDLSAARVRIAGSVGVSVSRGQKTSQKLIQEADASLYRVKAQRNGGGACLFVENAAEAISRKSERELKPRECV